MASFSAGTTFTDGVANDVTAAKLAALVNAATPTSGLIQDRTAETTIAANDTLLFGDFSDSSNLKRMTVANFAGTLPTATITTLNSTTGTITTLNSTTGTITTGVIPTLTSITKITSGTGTDAAPAISPTGDTNTGIFFPAADTIAFSEGGAEAMRIDSSGQVGVGVTPSGWGASEYKAIQVGIGGSISGRVSGGDQDKVNVAANIYNDGTVFRYIASDDATVYQQSGGIHTFSNAPSGTAGNTATFTERLRIDSSGNVGVGVTPSGWGASEYKAIQVGIGGSISGRVSGGDQDKVNVAANVYHDGTNFKYIASDDATVYQQLGGLHTFSNAPSGTAGNTATFTERLRIDGSGNVSIGTATALSKLHVHGDLTMSNATTAITASTSTITPPATVAGYLTVSINGTSRKIAFYAT